MIERDNCPLATDLEWLTAHIKMIGKLDPEVAAYLERIACDPEGIETESAAQSGALAVRTRNLRRVYESLIEAAPEIATPQQNWSTGESEPKFDGKIATEPESTVATAESSHRESQAFMASVGLAAKRIVTLLACVGLGALLIWYLFQAYDWVVDSSGYVSHSVEASISAQQNWIVGETKPCFSVPLDKNTAKLLNKSVGYVAETITCDDGPYHTIQVKLYGRTEQPKLKVVTWRCTRETDSFTCRQTGLE